MDELINEFLEEASESLTKLDQDFVELEQNPQDKDIVKEIFRVMHTLKGTSGFLGFSRLEKIAHSAENLMDMVRNDQLEADQNMVSHIFKSIDKIREIVEDIEAHGEEPEGDDSQIIKDLDDFANKKHEAQEESEEQEAEASQEEEHSESVVKDEPVNKTPDLDEEIDFDPIPADFADTDSEGQESEGQDAEVQDSQGQGAEEGSPKTPDLDEEIDFDPIPADFADMDSQTEESTEDSEQEQDKKQDKGQNKENLPAAQAKDSLSEEEKKKAVNAGLKATEGKPKPVRKTSQSIRVSLDVLENLMQLVGELVLTRNQLLQLRRSSSENVGSNFGTSLQRLNIITTELQEGVMKTRMQPINNVWSTFPRVIRDLANDLNKKIQLKMVGEDTELDRQMLEAIKDPLTHMIRNAADHGIEKPEERLEKGKAEFGTITMSAYHEGGHIIIKISDDGKGIDVDVIKNKCIEKGLASKEELSSLSDNQIMQFIFKPGFSTAQQLSNVSGRGVGMDVVLNNIESIGGTLEIDSVFGKGSEFLVKLPLTLAIMPVLTVETAEEIFAIPQIMVSEIVRVGKSKKSKLNKEEDKSHKIEIIHGSPVLRLRGKLLSLISLADVLGLDRPQDEEELNENENFVVVLEVGSNMFGIMVDKVFHTEEIVVKPKSPLIKDLEVYSGSTILGDGSVILIIDPNGLLRYSGVSSLGGQRTDITEKSVFDKEEISFLLFRTKDKTQKAIPLELVSRLEEIDYSKIEDTGGSKVVQYRDSLMKLVSIDEDQPIPEEGVHDTIVFADRGKVMGVYADKILDIINSKMELKSDSKKKGVLGSMILAEAATDIIDISYFISQNFSEWLGHEDANKIEGEEETEDDRFHVLLVDDSAFFRKFMRPVILAAGYKVTTAEDGVEGLEILKQYTDEFNIVITDIDMPRMNGLEFTAEAKSIAEIKKIPFVALTSHKEEDFDHDIKDLGFNSLVTKSDRNKVIEIIADILNDKKVAL